MDNKFAPAPTREKGGYYKLSTGAECIEIVEDIADRENIPGRIRMLMGNSVEYTWRCGKKPGEDWREALFNAANELYRAVTGEWLGSEQKAKLFSRYHDESDIEAMR